jgi:hypothetical protein
MRTGRAGPTQEPWELPTDANRSRPCRRVFGARTSPQRRVPLSNESSGNPCRPLAAQSALNYIQGGREWRPRSLPARPLCSVRRPGDVVIFAGTCRGGSDGGTNADLPADLRKPAGETGEMLVDTKDGPMAAQSSSIMEYGRTRSGRARGLAGDRKLRNQSREAPWSVESSIAVRSTSRTLV